MYNASMKRKNVTKLCKECGQTFNPQYGREKESLFCSPACYLQNRWGKTPKNNCGHCGIDISWTGKRTQKFCSFECRVRNQTGKKRKSGVIKYGKGGRYYARLVPEHPGADGKGYVMIHRLIIEASIGRFLTQDEVVHHRDGNGHNNDISNLEIMSTSEHNRLHTQDRWDNGTFHRDKTS
jgi:hypothetical protein